MADVLTDTYRKIRQRLRAVAAGMLGSDDEADDALQDAFCKLWSSHGDITSEESALGLLTVAVRNTGIDYLRRRRPMADASVIGDVEDETHSHDEELYTAITTLIEQRLTERQRQILYQRDRDGWDFEEIAEYHNLTEANVRVILSRARQTVREIYIQKNNKS